MDDQNGQGGNQPGTGQRMDGVLEVINAKDRAIVRVGPAQVPVPTLRSSDQELDGFNAFLARTQLGAIERRKQKQVRQILADREIDVLKERTDAIVESYKGLTQVALLEVLVAAQEYGTSCIRESEMRDQAALYRVILGISIQYRDFIAQVAETNFSPDTFSTVNDAALKIYHDKLAKVMSANFRIR